MSMFSVSRFLNTCWHRADGGRPQVQLNPTRLTFHTLNKFMEKRNERRIPRLAAAGIGKALLGRRAGRESP